VILQNCASGGGRLDFGILSRFHNTELSDFLRAPRALKIFNGMTWVLPPEYLLRTFGTETGGMEADGDLDLQLRQALMARPIFRGIAPNQAEFNPLLRAKIRSEVARFKDWVRPVMAGARVYHHTPLTEVMQPAPWVVLEYARPDHARAAAWLFRTSADGAEEWVLRPRGLDQGRRYRVTLANSGQSFEMDGADLASRGIPVPLSSTLTSAMLLFEAAGSGSR
jgi:alpha-galactosidase